MPRQELVTGLLGVWLLLALFVDGWAHFNRPALETFFTPWHAALYGGLSAMGAWVTRLVWRNHRRGLSLRQSVPAGYGATVVGMGIFALGGMLDLVWHEVFGIEVGIDALVSPTHLVLATGGLLIVGTGMRSERAPGRQGLRTWTAPAVVSLALSTALVSFFLLYTSAFADPAPATKFVPTPEGAPGHEAAELPVVSALAGYLVTTTLMMVPILYVLARSARPPRGIFVVVVSTVGWLAVGVVNFPLAGVSGMLGATVAAVLADLALTRLPAAVTRRGLPLLVAGVTALIWTGQLVGVALSVGIEWPVSLWFGVVVLSAGAAAALAMLASPQSSGRSSWPEARS